MREELRLRHYSIRTEQAYVDWARRYVRFHHMRTRAELFPGESKIEEFLSDLAINGRVAASTQNQELQLRTSNAERPTPKDFGAGVQH